MKQVPGRHGGMVNVLEKGDKANAGAGRPLGSKNRSTIAREILATTVHMPDKIYNELVKVFPQMPKITSAENAISVVQAYKAITGAVLPSKFGYELLMDSGYGKPKGDDQAGLNIPSGSQIIINLSKEDGKSDDM
jgi:hypothetical protein